MAIIAFLAHVGSFMPASCLSRHPYLHATPTCNCLTQVAIIAFLAHVGSFVPASSARIGLVDRIFTRLASREAAALPQSAFMLDLTQVAAMLRLSTER